jgi:hypothetical protein
MKRMRRKNLNTRKLNRGVTIGKSREAGHSQTKEPAKPTRVLTIKK